MADQDCVTCILADQVYDSCSQVVAVTGTSTCAATASAAACVGAPSCTLFGTPTPVGNNDYSVTVQVTQPATYNCDGVATPVDLVGYATCVLSVPTGLNAADVAACFAFTPLINGVFPTVALR
ncbi:hypothetical protein [Sulfobacillus harzensis]|uniref:Uncharacterized protein n=1 Tax=Sulfobacillus harzensis TaxID=2729629 RepID=A0A7Y0Q1F4_9FIRM|nr:hypothetical protein [Sulfobacillus harzensis]NMP22038.1 hypothetical protein [Sulfobacillus harzensis]